VFGGTTQATCTLPGDLPASPLTDEIVAVELSPERVEVVAQLPLPRAASCAVARDDGTILLFGGVDYIGYTTELGDSFGPEATDEVLVFDPKAQTVQPHAIELPAPRAGMACVRAATGQAILAGGLSNEGKTVDELLLFEPYAQTGELLGPVTDTQQASARWTDIVIDGDTAGDTALSVSLRIAESAEQLEAAAWLPVAGTGALPDDLPRGRLVQWRVELISTNPMATPRLRAITLTYTAE
jgi:hypothetical protein